MFEVPAGGRRFRALELLVKQKRLAKIAPVPCVVSEASADVLIDEVSLAENIDLSPEVVLLLAQAVRSNVRELEGALIRLAAKSSLVGHPIDLDFVRQELSVTVPRITETSIDDIQRAVCHHFKLTERELCSKDRHKSIAFARHIAMYLCKQRLKASFPEIGRAFGNRDHTTVMSAVRKVELLRENDAEVRAHLEAIERKIASE